MLNAWEATVGTAIEKHAAAMVQFNASLQFFHENSGLSPSVTPSYRRAWRDYQSEQRDIVYNDPATDIAAQHKEFVIKIEANEKTKNMFDIAESTRKHEGMERARDLQVRRGDRYPGRGYPEVAPTSP